jgi:hypothetical protein
MTYRDTAVLLIAFNRPETTIEVFNCIRNAQPKRLYIAADGPRKNNHDDLQKCELVRAIKDKVDWDCVVKTKYSDKNLGCKNGVASAINWLFENEDEGIILEDDIIPESGFFSYCSEMLNLYRDNEKVKAVLGFNLYGQSVANNSHFLYEGFYPWGWATWRRAWNEYNPEEFDLKKIMSLSENRKSHKFLYQSIDLNLRLIKKGLLDTWDYQFMYMMICRGGYSVAPYANLIKNIGVDGAHSSANTLSFDYGIFDVENMSLEAKLKIDEKMNSLFLLEHERSARLVFLKKVLLSLRIYKILKGLRKSYRDYQKKRNK